MQISSVKQWPGNAAKIILNLARGSARSALAFFHSAYEMLSVDFGMLQDLSGPCWKGNL
jgi:hypothetical protein